MLVKPFPGKLLRNPANWLPLRAEGENVPNNSFWRRRVKMGDVILMDDNVNASTLKQGD
jgi:hypothetical protein